MQAVSSASLCNAFFDHHDRTFLAQEDCFGHAFVFYLCDMASLAKLHLKQDGFYAGQAGFLEDFFARHVVLPFDPKDGAQAGLLKPLQ